MPPARPTRSPVGRDSTDQLDTRCFIGYASMCVSGQWCADLDMLGDQHSDRQE